MKKNKEIIIEPLIDDKSYTQFIKKIIKLGINLFLVQPEKINVVKELGGVTFSESEDVDITIVNNINSKLMRNKKSQIGLKLKMRSNNDIQLALEAAKKSVSTIFVETSDWKIIPLENLVADIHRFSTRIFSKVQNIDEIQTLFSILELGIDGIILPVSEINQVESAIKELSALKKIKLAPAEVVEIKNLGVGERVCIDTASILREGEGILVGSQSRILFLVHNESAGSKFTSPRPFRVNAGSIHSYVLMPDYKTKYLSEIESGTEVLAVDKEGNSRVVIVGRIKIERRPLSLLKVKHEGIHGSALLQNAETIPLIGERGNQIPITQLKVGEKILVRIDESSGRHFGVAVNEFIIEK